MYVYQCKCDNLMQIMVQIKTKRCNNVTFESNFILIHSIPIK